MKKLIRMFCFSLLAFCLFQSFPFSSAYGKDKVAYFVYDVENEKVVAKQNHQDPMVLASVSKLLTMYFGLKVLGANYRFKTSIVTNGLVEKGVLKGDLILVGSGEPYLTAPHLISLIHQLQEQGIKKIQGRFIVDDSAVWSGQRISLLGLEDQPDNPAAGALNAEFNRYQVTNYGESIYPPMEGWKVKKSGKANHGLKFSLIRQKGINKIGEEWIAYDKEKLKFNEDLPTRNNALWVGSFFRFLAKRFRLDLPQPVQGKAPAQVRLLAFHYGLPLYRLASLGLEYSNNLIAESILKVANTHYTQKIQSSFESAQRLLSWLRSQRKLNKLKWEKSNLANGSGLTVENKVSAETMAKFLAKVGHEKFEGRSFMSLQSINGHSGSIGKRLMEVDLAYRVFAKTGSLYYVNNLAGYFVGKSNRLFAFALLTTDSEKRKSLNGANSAKSNQLRKEFKQWYSTSTGKIDGLVRDWIQKY